jgi:SAM-dependent methyltransferase
LKIDYERVREILAGTHTYYGKEDCRMERESVMVPNIGDFLQRAFAPGQRVLDIGCGNGKTLIKYAALFGEGVGIDNSEDHIHRANQNKEASGIQNVTFVNCPSFALPFENAYFDFAFSERGPLSGSSINIQSALRVLKPGGMIFAETPGHQNHKEPDLVFHPESALKSYWQMDRVEEAKVVFERNGVDVRLVSSHLEKLCFPNIYEWVKYQCTLWGSEGWPPSPELETCLETFHRIAADASGRIRITCHLLWVAGLKQDNPPEYWEHRHFD